jgi:nucleoside phosphorylase
MLSGDKLIDNIDFRDQLKSLFPDTLGGEMEGVGLYSACAEEKVDWIIVKSVCDWADGNKKVNKERRQRNAAVTAMNFVFHTISRGGFANTV